MNEPASDLVPMKSKGLTLCVCITTENRDALAQALMDLAGVIANVRSFSSQAAEGMVCVSCDTRSTH